MVPPSPIFLCFRPCLTFEEHGNRVKSNHNRAKKPTARGVELQREAEAAVNQGAPELSKATFPELYDAVGIVSNSRVYLQ